MHKVAEEKSIRGKRTKERADRPLTSEWIEARKDLLNHLEQMQKKGVKLFVDGKSAQPGEIAYKAVREGSNYMADYVLGENGAIEQVRFDRVMRR